MGIKTWFRENLRLVIHRFPLVYKWCLMFVRDYGKHYYRKLDRDGRYSEALRRLKNSKKGKRCFIIGNGPSLKVEDLEKLTQEDCFGSNRIYKIFPQTKWRPLYYTTVDWRGLDNDEVNALDTPYLFVGDYFWRKHRVTRDRVYVFYGHRLLDTKLSSFRFSSDITKEVYLAATVTYANIQIAAYMGYSEIYLLGMDHTYAYVRDQKGGVVRNEKVASSHFFQDNDPSKNYGDMDGMTNAYIAAKQYADEHGICIYNATRGGALEVFPRVEFDQLF